MKIYFLLIIFSLKFINNKFLFSSNRILQTDKQSYSTQNSVDCNPIVSSVQSCFSQCIVMYKGSKNYFNQNTGQCEATAQCTSLQIYNISNNSCSPIPISNLNYPNINSNINAVNTNQIQIPQIVCINGNLIANNTICICNQGYTDGPQDATKPNIVVKCAQYNSPSNSTSNVANQINTSNYYPYPIPANNSTLISEPNNLSTINNLVIIISCLVVTGYLCCGLIFFCKYRMKLKQSSDIYSVPPQPIPIYTSQIPSNNLTNLDNISRSCTNRDMVFKPHLKQSIQYENRTVNSYRDASFNKRYRDYQKNRDENSSVFYESPIKNLRKIRKPRSEFNPKKGKRNNSSDFDD